MLTVASRISLARTGPMPKIYCSEVSMRFWLGMSTPPRRAARGLTVPGLLSATYTSAAGQNFEHDACSPAAGPCLGLLQAIGSEDTAEGLTCTSGAGRRMGLPKKVLLFCK